MRSLSFVWEDYHDHRHLTYDFVNAVTGFEYNQRVNWISRLQSVSGGNITIDYVVWPEAPQLLEFGNKITVRDTGHNFALFTGYIVDVRLLSTRYLQVDLRGICTYLNFPIELPLLQDLTAGQLVTAMLAQDKGEFPAFEFHDVISAQFGIHWHYAVVEDPNAYTLASAVFFCVVGPPTPALVADEGEVLFEYLDAYQLEGSLSDVVRLRELLRRVCAAEFGWLIERGDGSFVFRDRDVLQQPAAPTLHLSDYGDYEHTVYQVQEQTSFVDAGLYNFERVEDFLIKTIIEHGVADEHFLTYHITDGEVPLLILGDVKAVTRGSHSMIQVIPSATGMELELLFLNGGVPGVIYESHITATVLKPVGGGRERFFTGVSGGRSLTLPYLAVDYFHLQGLLYMVRKMFTQANTEVEQLVFRGDHDGLEYGLLDRLRLGPATTEVEAQDYVITGIHHQGHAAQRDVLVTFELFPLWYVRSAYVGQRDTIDIGEHALEVGF